MPPTLPGALTRRAKFDQHVSDAVIHLSGHTSDVLHLDVVVAEVPSDTAEDTVDSVFLGELDRGQPSVVLHRRPILARAAVLQCDVEVLVRDVLAELVAQWLSRDAGDVDPHYPRV